MQCILYSWGAFCIYRKGTNFHGVLNFAVFANHTLSANLIPIYICARDLHGYTCARIGKITYTGVVMPRSGGDAMI